MNALGLAHSGRNTDINMPQFDLNMCKSQQEADQFKQIAKDYRNYAKWTKTKFASLASASESWRNMQVYKNAFLKSHLGHELTVRRSYAGLNKSCNRYTAALNDINAAQVEGGGSVRGLLPF